LRTMTLATLTSGGAGAAAAVVEALLQAAAVSIADARTATLNMAGTNDLSARNWFVTRNLPV